MEPIYHREIEAVARSLAKSDEQHVSAAEWASEVGNRYRRVAFEALLTFQKVKAGNNTGGLPPISQEQDPGG